MKTFKNSTQPGAWIVNPHDRGRKAIKGEKNIYLNPNQEFAIELYNPLSRCILANIKLNGDLISTKGLVLRPGERSYLDCFIDDQRKFIFTTYSVENTNLNQEAIQNNGSIEIFFYEEEHLYIWQTEIYPVFNTYWYKSYFNTSNPWPNPWYGTSNPTYTTTDYNGYSSISYSSNNLNPQNLTCSNSTIETGRVERGTKSEQQFQDVIKNFSNYLLHS